MAQVSNPPATGALPLTTPMFDGPGAQSLGRLTRPWLSWWQSLVRIQSNELLTAYGDPLILTTSFEYIDNAFVQLDRDGTWLITGVFDFLATSGCGICEGQLEFNGTEFNGLTPPATGDYAVLSPAAGTSLEATVSTVWKVENAGLQYAKLLARKTSNGGSASINKATKLFALFVG